MKNALICMLALLSLPYSNVYSQKKLRKSDRQIVANIQTHTNFLNGDKLAGRKAGSEGEKLADDYIAKQFSRAGLKPAGSKEWYQAFPINDGKEVNPATSLTINNDKLVLFRDYFPFAFSANKSAEAAVAVALAENDVPWFKDIKEIISDDDSGKVDTFAVIRSRAKHAAAKGASALIIYNKSGDNDIAYNRYDGSAPVEIPVLYINSKAFKKYADDESAILDVKLNVDLEEKNRTGNNVVGIADNGADSIVVASANLGKEDDVAALLEVARLLKANKSKSYNYVFVAFSGEKDGQAGAAYFREHPPLKSAAVNRTLALDSLADTVGEPKGLNLVKRSVELIKN